MPATCPRRLVFSLTFVFFLTDVVIACGLKNNFTLKFSPAGIYKSVDFGATFSPIPAVSGRCRDLVNDPLNPTHFYASFLENEGIFSSVDSGDTWQQMIPDLIQTTTFSDLKAPNARLSLHSTANSRVLWALLPGLSVLPTDVMILRGEYNFLGGTWSFSPLTSVPFTNGSIFPQCNWIFYPFTNKPLYFHNLQTV